MRGLYKLLMAFAMFAISTATYAQLSDEERYELMSKVKAEYEMSNIDGTKILNVKNKYVLVDLEIMQSTMKEAYQARAAKIKATRTMGEFLKGAKNKSKSEYGNYSEEDGLYIIDNGIEKFTYTNVRDGLKDWLSTLKQDTDTDWKNEIEFIECLK